jgi:E3 ubiquitin-protein ligase HERC3
MGGMLPIVDLGTVDKVKQIALGNFHACAILMNDTVKCWGRNLQGQLGLGDAAARGDADMEMGDALEAVDLGTKDGMPMGVPLKAVAIDAGDSHTCAILDDGSLKCWGFNDYGQLGYEDTAERGKGPDQMGNKLLAIDLGGRKAIAVRAAGNFTCALLDDTSVKCWGDNAQGSLGYGDTVNRGDALDEMGTYLPIVKLFSDTW